MEKIGDGFFSKWNYPFCVDTLDGKHIASKRPDNSWSEHFNYKGYFSIVLLALASYDYKLIFIDVGASGRHGDTGLFESSSLKAKMDEKSIGFLESDVLWNNGLKCHYHIIGDDAFPFRNRFPSGNLYMNSIYLTTDFQELEELLKMYLELWQIDLEFC